MKSARRRVLQFIAVGTLAAAVHMGVVVALVQGLQWAPLVANVAGWAVAFVVSFSGHRMLSFSDLGAAFGPSVARFALVSAGGFALNELTYAVLLRYAGLPYHLTLGVVLVAVAVATYLLSRHWAFLGTPGP